MHFNWALKFLKEFFREVRKKLTENFAYLSVGILVLSIAISRTGLVSRFPWEDLYWNDLQIYNSWRWFNETLRDSGLFSTLRSVIDFRQNTGDFFVSSTKWSNPVLDIGAWLSFFTGNYVISFLLKFGIIAIIGGFGLYKLMSINPYFDSAKSKYKLLLFSTLFSSMIFHPLLNGEVGPLNQWYLLLIPNWFLILSNNISTKSSKKSFLSAQLCTLTVLSLGSSDLFFISTITSLYFVFFIKCLIERTNYIVFIKQYIFVLSLFILDKSWLILGQFKGGNQYSSKGSWEPGYYFAEYIYPLFRNTVLIPRFEGPGSLFINLSIILLLFCAWQNRRNSDFMKMALILLAVTFMLLLAGFIAHSVPVIRNSLPSAVRYHLTFLPFGIVAILARYANFSTGKKVMRKTLILSNLGVFFLSILVTFAILTLNIGSYGGKVPPTSRYFLSSQTNAWYMSALPSCINKHIIKGNHSEVSRSFIFVKKSGTENYMDDSLLILSELPDRLKGRTFQQWRYSVGKLNANLLQESGSSGLFTRPFLPDNVSGIKNFSNNSLSPFIISSERMSNNAFDFLGSCKFPQNLSTVVGQNPTLGADVYLYYSKYVFDPKTFELLDSNYGSSKVDYLFECARKNQAGEIDLNLPINYDENIRITANGANIPFYSGNSNEIVIKFGGSCSVDNTLSIEISSDSTLNLTRMLSIIFLTVLLPFYLLRRNRVKGKLDV